MHSPLPLEQFARVLQETGFPGLARQTLYEGKTHEFRQSLLDASWVDASWLLATGGLIGYGHRVWYELGWITLFLALAGGLPISPERRFLTGGSWSGIWGSLGLGDRRRLVGRLRYQLSDDSGNSVAPTVGTPPPRLRDPQPHTSTPSAPLKAKPKAIERTKNATSQLTFHPNTPRSWTGYEISTASTVWLEGIGGSPG